MTEGVLSLTLAEPWFSIMRAGKKGFEYREPSQWIMSRLVDKAGKNRKYEWVKFTHGYKKNAPYFYMRYNGFTTAAEPYSVDYDGKTVMVEKGHVIIVLGDPVEEIPKVGPEQQTLFT